VNVGQLDVPAALKRMRDRGKRNREGIGRPLRLSGTVPDYVDVGDEPKLPTLADVDFERRHDEGQRGVVVGRRLPWVGTDLDDARPVRPAKGALLVDAVGQEEAAGASGPAIDRLMIVAEAPLILGSLQNTAGHGQPVGFVEKLLEPRERVSAGRRQSVQSVVEADDLAGEKFAVALKRLGDAASVMRRQDQDAGRLPWIISRAALALSLQQHTEGIPQD
jgi:hypothetical protein